MNRTITLADLKKLIQEKKDVSLLDVRRNNDFDADPQMIPGALRRGPEEIDQWSKEIPPDKEIVIYCARGGSVSNAVLDRLLEKRINARYLEGGIAAWKESSSV